MAVSIDRVDVMALEEVDGVVKSLQRRMRVSGLSDTDFEVLYSALDEAGVPAADSTLPGRLGLVVKRRSVKLLPREQSKCDVDIFYEKLQESVSNFVFSGGSSLKHLVTQNDRNGAQIILSHTFPAGDPDFPNETRSQGGEVNVLYPQTGITATGLLAVDFPHFITAQWIGFRNATTWAGGSAGTWLITGARFTPHDLSAEPKQWIFEFEFSADTTGWQPETVYIDERTGKPPPNIVEGVGTTVVDWYPTRDYSELFPL